MPTPRTDTGQEFSLKERIPKTRRSSPEQRSRSTRNWWRDVAALIVISALTIVYFAPLLTGQTSTVTGSYGKFVYPWAAVPNDQQHFYPQSDYAELSYPWNVRTDAALEQGTVPLWSADAYAGGYDLYANGSSALFYPPRLLALAVTSPSRAHDLFLVFHLWASGVAMYLLCRQLSRGRPAATVAAVAWMFATWNTGWMQLEVVTPMALFLPATVAAVHRAMTRRTAAAVVGAGAVCALAAQAGHVLMLGLTLLAAGFYAVALTVSAAIEQYRSAGNGTSSRWQAPARVLACFVGLGLAAGGLAAVLLVPTAATLLAGQRTRIPYYELTAHSLADRGMFSRLLLPPPLPLTANGMNYLGYTGMTTAALAVVGLLSRNRTGAWLARSLVVITPAVMLGTPLTWLVWRFVPGMNVFQAYARLIVLVAFGIVIAAAIGTDVLADAWHRRSPRTAEFGGGVVGIAVIAVLVLVTAAQLIPFGWRANPPFLPHETRYLLPPTPMTEYLRTQSAPGGWPARTAAVLLQIPNRPDPSPLLYGNTPQVVGLDTTSGYDSNVDRRTLALLQVLDGADPATPGLGTLGSAYRTSLVSDRTRFELLARLGITHVATVPTPADAGVSWSPSWAALGAEVVQASNDGILYQIPGAVAGPRVVANDEVVDDGQAALERFVDPAFPWTDRVVIERTELERTALDPLGPAGPGAGDGAAGTVVAATRGINTIAVSAWAERAAWLLIPDHWADGWRATVNGKAAPVVRVDYAFRAVRLEPGESTVTMRYRPPGLRVGAAISAVTAVGSLAAVACNALVARARRRRSQAPDGSSSNTSW